MFVCQNQNKSKLRNKKLKNFVIFLSLLSTTVGINNAYAYRQTLIRDAHDAVTQTARIRHDTVTLAVRTLEDTAVRARRVLPVHPGPLTQAKRSVEDFFTSFKRSVRDQYVDLKRNVRDTYVSLKREVEDLF